MTEPTTEAGKRLLDEWFPGSGDGLDHIDMSAFCAAILAIEQEAADAALERVERAERAVASMTYAEGAPSDLSAESFFGRDGFEWCQQRVLAAIRVAKGQPR